MLLDLSGLGNVLKEADYVVIGAGTVGLPVSVRLAELLGAKVICLESGAEVQADDIHRLNEVVHLSSEYGGAAHGRYRCLGGTSTRWGGALIPMQEADLSQDVWPLALSDLKPYLKDVEELFELADGPYEDPQFNFDLGENHVNRLAKWPPFKKRNVVNIVGSKARALQNLQVWLNSAVIEIIADESGDSVRVVACSAGGDRITVTAQKLIIAAGAIETTRLTLLINRQNKDAATVKSSALGRYFSDHISAGIAEIKPRRNSALNKTIGFRFDKSGGMRNIRFELAPDTLLRAKLPPSFTHIGFESNARGGFDALREIFRRLQMRRMPSLRIGLDLLSDIPWLARAVWWRFVHKRLLFPANARLIVHVVIEQPPRWENFIDLSTESTDCFGVPLAVIDWHVDQLDIDLVNLTADAFENSWNGSQLSDLGELQRFPRDEVETVLKGSSGIYHPTGSTRMGREAEIGVVDADLRLFAFPQIQLLASSVLPTGGGANPTMMLFLLAMRCVDQHRNTRSELPPENPTMTEATI